jgi:DNA-binding CsgD family transcriptional regulator
LAEGVGRDHFGPLLIRLLDAWISADDCMVIVQKPRGIESVVDETHHDKQQFCNAISLYTDRFLDRQRRIVTQRMPSRTSLIKCHRMLIDKIETERFRREFYYSLGVVDHIWCWAPYRDTIISLSALRRNGRGPFQTEQLERFTDILPMIVPLIICHADSAPSIRARGDDRAAGKGPDSASRLASIGGVRLAPREAQVCALILDGHTNIGISLHLGISENTVRTLRQRAYAKLGISTMVELFALTANRNASPLA